MKRLFVLAVIVLFIFTSCQSNIKQSDKMSSEIIPYDEFGAYIDSELIIDINNATEFPFEKIDYQDNAYFLVFNNIMETKRGIKVNDSTNYLAEKYTDVDFLILLSNQDYKYIKGKDINKYIASHEVTSAHYSIHILDGKLIDYWGNEEKYKDKEICAYGLSFIIDGDRIISIDLQYEKFVA